MGTCKNCKFFSASRCWALPPVFVGSIGGSGRLCDIYSWAHPAVSGEHMACSLYWPKEDVPALGEVLGEGSEV